MLRTVRTVIKCDSDASQHSESHSGHQQNMPHGFGVIEITYLISMKQDALNRRSRFAGRQPTGKRVILRERDYQCFAALERHGPLPSTYLYAITKHVARNFKGFQQRLTDLYNEDNTTHQGFYLERPEQQYASINARYQPMSYELTDDATRALRGRGIPVQSFELANGPYLHRFMTSCLTASIELAVKAAGHRYISQADIFTHAKCPKDVLTRDHPLALPCSDGVIIPDQIFGIDYGGKYRFFALEADRKTETVVSTKASAKAYAKKLESYLDVLRDQSFRDVWGIPSLSIVTVTTSKAHMQTMMAALADMTDVRQTTRFLFKTQAQFGKYWTVPPVLGGLFIESWQRVTTPLDISSSSKSRIIADAAVVSSLVRVRQTCRLRQRVVTG